ncbi:hypothetical protein GCM10007913_14700 [Devosia yakushimensis]|uniref:DUF983 domain-containing protein n=2 Tax=Devosia yakushimensis TaxID=470028 RepID=A0ABQ5UD46_9HYPH|nr:hypothetical protein GCM10007913_14700 [Devosia yakushimensis]
MTAEVTTLEDRQTWQAIWRGTLCKCPHCGKGKMFRSYLKVTDYCASCGEQLDLHRADDFPPYIAIMIVGHLLVAVMLHIEMTWHINPMTYIYTMVPLAIILPLAILPSTKGAIVGFQWAKRMHGFGHPDEARN